MIEIKELANLLKVQHQMSDKSLEKLISRCDNTLLIANSNEDITLGEIKEQLMNNYLVLDKILYLIDHEEYIKKVKRSFENDED